jgi:cytochrome c oxidase subunit 2
MTMRRAVISIAFASLVTGCRDDNFQSVLHPASEEARAIAWLWWTMLFVYGSVFLITIGLTGVAIFRKRAKPESPSIEPPGGAARFVVVAGIVVPSVILLAMLVLALHTGSALRSPATTMTIRVTAHQWWWDVRYGDDEVITANEIVIPVGVAVGLELGSGDVIHSFWVPNLHGKMDMVPDHRNRFWIRADKVGTYRGICAEFCGDQHAWMGLDVIVLEAQEFDDWLAQRRQTRPPNPIETRGLEIFTGAGCAACHAIRATEAIGSIGPNLTHVASRRMLGASTIPNSRASLRRWITEPQALKPGNLMPTSHLEADELELLLDYLMTLQ